MGAFWQDLRYAIRMLRKSPGFTAVAVLTLGLGIGANTAIFSVVRTVLLKSLPYPDPDRLMVLREHQVRSGQMAVSWMDFLDWRQQSTAFEDMAVYCTDHFVLTGSGEPDQIRAARVSASFFPILGARPLVGRTFNPREDAPGAAPTAVLSYALWRARLGGDSTAVGKSVILDGTAYTIVGVLGPDFRYFQQRVDLYIPAALKGASGPWLSRGNHPGLSVVARLRPGASLGSARAEMDTITKQLEAQYPVSNTGISAEVTPLYESQYSDIRPALLILLAAVGCVLMIACANVANLSLARAVGRQKEFAIRAAIGAGGSRIIRQLLTESVVLSLMGGFLGLLIAGWTIGPLLHIAPQDIPRLAETQIDRSVFIFNFAAALLTGILFGLAPAFQASRADANAALRKSGRGATPGRSHHGLRAGLLISEVALAVVLVIGSGLLIRSLLEAAGVNPGFRAEKVLALDVNLPGSKYSTNPQQSAFLTQTMDRVRNLPGVESASAVYCPPLVGDCWDSVFIFNDRSVPPQAELPASFFNIAEPQYFATMQVPLLAGRNFTQADDEKSSLVVLINQTAARLWWPHESPLGKRIKQGFPQDKTPFREIVGVVGDIRQDGLDQTQHPEIFEPLAQAPSQNLTLVVRTTTAPMNMRAAVEEAIRAVDKEQPLSAVEPMTQYISESLARRKFSTLLLGLFGGLALLLAAVGIYGVMAYTVTQRRHELGIRMALGAQGNDLFGLVVGSGLRLALAGIAIGLVASLALTRLLRSLLFGVSGMDPATFAAVSILLCIVALAACYIPARRAMRVDPMVALRYE